MTKLLFEDTEPGLSGVCFPFLCLIINLSIMEDSILNDFEHSVTDKIKKFGKTAGFPMPEDYGITKELLDDYLFDKQALIDSLGSEKSQYTQAGILIVLPVIIAAAFPEESLPGGALGGSLISIAIGIVLALLVAGIQRLIRRIRLRRLYDAKIENYIDKVLNYE